MARRKCTLCPLHEGARWNNVPPDLPEGGVDILCVGEAPGRTEDQQGRPFVGEAGRLLRATLSDVLGNTFSIGYTNVCRCRPPNNRAPTPKERKICTEQHLDPEIEKLNPRLIIALGASALRALTGQGGVLKNAGRVYHGRILACAHPAYVLRNPGYRSAWHSTLASARGILIGADAKVPQDYRLLTDEEEIEEILFGLNGPVAFDYETTGLDPHSCRVTSVAVCSEEGTAYSFEPPVALWQRWLASDVEKIVHNVMFEGYWSLSVYGVYPVNMIWDTYLGQRITNENEPAHLKTLAIKHTDLGAYDDKVQALVEERGWDQLTIADLWWYNCADSDATLRVYNTQRQLPGNTLSADGSATSLTTLMTSSLMQARACILMRNRGMTVKRKKIPGTLVKVLRDLEETLHTLRGLSLVKSWEKKRCMKFNPRSPDQCRSLLYRYLGLEESKYHRTKAGNAATGQEFLNSVEDVHPVVPLLLRYKRLDQLRKNFLVPMVQRART